MKIGVFDSGVGGLTVLKQAIAAYPKAHYLYFADTDHVPYGTKTKKEIKALVLDAAAFLVDKDIDLLIIACNTATSVAVKALRKKYDLPIIGMEPAVKPAIRLKKSSRKILVCATKLTLKEKKLHDLIANLDASDDVKFLSLQKLVKFAEKKDFNSKKLHKYLEKRLAKIKWKKYKAMVLGCTHFLFYKEQLKKYMPDHIELIDGNNGTINRMLDLLPSDKKAETLKISYYTSKKTAEADNFDDYLQRFKP